MKIVRREFTPDGPGIVEMTPDDPDDLWVACNLIKAGDSVKAVTIRKVLREASSRSRDAERVKLQLEIKVEDVDYDKKGYVVTIKGKNTLKNEHVKIGQSHTLKIELHRPFVLKKVLWDSKSINALKPASDPSVSGDRAVVRALQDFFTMLNKDPDRTCYGPNHVEVANERKAVQKLLITDNLFRSTDVATRQRYEDLVNTVKDSGGTTHVFSSMDVSGQQLARYTGIAAILRFPLLELDDIEMIL
ncbi:protein PELOTA 1-like [Rutidosis leptorrhynchoides]|uniref:protein PELOTA 1-like n=1 Tax=Rutidosis leptorrhynchoides TaxID=125765 RepID=UPI003A992BFD